MKKMVAKLMVIGTGEQYCITSLQIAEQTGKDHPKVKRDIKNMLIGLGIDAAKFGGIYLDTMNRHQEMYILPEREGMILASGYDVKLRAMIVDAFLDAEPEQISDAERLMIVLQTTVANEKMVKKITQTQNLIEEAQESMSEEIKELKTNIEQQHRGIKDTIPRKGFKAIEGIYKRARLSRQMIMVVLERFGVPVCYCSKYVCLLYTSPSPRDS